MSTFNAPGIVQGTQPGILAHQELQRQEVIEVAMSYPMNQIVEHYQNDFGLTSLEALEHERELKRFLVICRRLTTVVCMAAR